jgi:hypothetical protein
MKANRFPIAAPLRLLVACGEPLPSASEISGPPCAPGAPADFVKHQARLKASEFNGVTLRRRSGHVSCRAYREGSVCHLSAPNFLQVSRGDEDWWFRPGVGERVVLAVTEAGPRCTIDKVQTTEAWARRHMGQTCQSARIKDCS